MNNAPSLKGYRLTEKIGEGGMATVYKAVQLSLDRPVALKMLAPELAADPNFTSRFMREARIIGRLAHACIVPIHEVGEQDGHYFIAMEYVTGGDLTDAMQTGLSEARIHSILTQIAQALGHAHSHNIVHRDIKPDNVLMRDPKTAMVADFGIAREIATQEFKTPLTEVRSIIGSPQYMSPEQMRAESLDQRTDIYSLGVVAWQLLTNELPHKGQTVSELAVAQATLSASELPVRLAHWQPLMNGLLAYHRDERFSNCGEVLAQLASLRTSAGTIVARQQAEVKPKTAGAAVQSRPAMGAYLALSSGLLSVAGMFLWWLLTTSSVGDTNLDPQEQGIRSSIPSVSLLPSSTEYFAFRDLLHTPDGQRTNEFVRTYGGSVLSDVIRVRQLNDRALLALRRQGADAGDLKSLLVMSELSANGWGMALDTTRAVEYARRAEQSGAIFAQFQLASLQLEALKNSNETLSRSISTPLQRAADGGFFLAQTLLAGLEYSGRISGERRVDRSVALLQRAADQGDRNALFNLAQIYRQGLDEVPQDAVRSSRYYSRAKELGHPETLAQTLE